MVNSNYTVTTSLLDKNIVRSMQSLLKLSKKNIKNTSHKNTPQLCNKCLIKLHST